MGSGVKFIPILLCLPTLSFGFTAHVVTTSSLFTFLSCKIITIGHAGYHKKKGDVPLPGTMVMHCPANC